MEPGAALVTNPDTVVLNGGDILFEDLVARDDLAVRLLHLLQAGEEVPKLGLRAGVVGAPQLHAVHLGFGHRIGGDVTTHDVELTVLLSLDYGGTARSATCSWLIGESRGGSVDGDAT